MINKAFSARSNKKWNPGTIRCRGFVFSKRCNHQIGNTMNKRDTMAAEMASAQQRQHAAQTSTPQPMQHGMIPTFQHSMNPGLHGLDLWRATQNGPGPAPALPAQPQQAVAPPPDPDGSYENPFGTLAPPPPPPQAQPATWRDQPNSDYNRNRRGPHNMVGQPQPMGKPINNF